MKFIQILLAALLISNRVAGGEPLWPTQALSLGEVLSLALQFNASIKKGRQDSEEALGISIQQKAVSLPKVSVGGAYQQIDEGKIEKVAFAPRAPTVSFQNNQSWNANLTVSQPLLAGGRIASLRRSSSMTREAVLAHFQALVANTLLEVRIAFFDILLAAEQIGVQEASMQLLERELADTQRRFDAGTVPKFNVLRAEVELANARPLLIRARNRLRIGRSSLALLLGFEVPANTDGSIPLKITGRLEAEALEVTLSGALAKALQRRPELEALRVATRLRQEEVIQARSDYYPMLSGVAGYGWQSRNFVRDLTQDLNGWTVGAQLNWNFLDFGATRGKVIVARSREEKARIESEDTRRRIEHEVRSAHSGFLEARDVLGSQTRVIGQAEEALRLVGARAEAGSGTQLDVLSAQTALTQTRTVYSQALHDWSVARARLERAMGEGVSLVGAATVR
ncbi:MAG: TolC family protein [Pedosphaera sp.]|nr:TolC family protein [Pedosphaera sp.]